MRFIRSSDRTTPPRVGTAPPVYPVPRAARDDRHALVVAQLRELRDFLRRAWKDDEIGGRAFLRAVRAVGVARGRVLKHERAADDAGGP